MSKPSRRSFRRPSRQRWRDVLSRELPIRPPGQRRFAARHVLLPFTRLVEGNPQVRQQILRGPRLLMVLVPLVFLALLLIIGRRYVLQRVDVERIVRAEVIPRLEREIGRPIEIGRVESDWLSRVVIHDIVVGRDPASPAGALLQVRRATLDVDAVGLLMRRKAGLSAVSGVALESPQIDLRRDARGRINWLELFNKGRPGEGEPWAGWVRVKNGRIFYRDATVRSRSGRVLVSQARGVDGEAVLHGAGPTQFALTIPKLFLRGEPNALRDLAVSGEVDADTKWALAKLSVPAAPLPLLAQWALPRGEADFRAGTVGAQVQVAYDATARPARQWLTRGDVQLRNASGWARDLKMPRSTTPLPIQNASGDFSFVERAAVIRNLRLTALNTTADVRGTLALPNTEDNASFGPIFDLNVVTAGADTTRLLALLPSQALNGTLIRAGRAPARVRVRGDARNLRADGEITWPALSVRRAGNNGQSSRLATQFDLAATLNNGVLQAASGRATLSAPDFSFGAANTAARGTTFKSTLSFAARRRGSDFDGNITADFGARTATVASKNQSAARADGWRGTLRGASQAGGLRLIASMRSNGVALQTGTGSRTSLNGDGMEAAAWFVGTASGGRAAASATLRDWQARNQRLGALRGREWRLTASTSQISPQRPTLASWSGATQWRDLDAAGFNLGSLSPVAAQQVRNSTLR